MFFLFAKLILFFLSRKIFDLAFKAIPFSPILAHFLTVLIPTVGKSVFKSWLLLGNLSSIPFFLSEEENLYIKESALFNILSVPSGPSIVIT